MKRMLQFLLRDGKARAEVVATQMRRRWIQQSFKLLNMVIEEEKGKPMLIDYMAGEKVSSTEMKRFSLRK